MIHKFYDAWKVSRNFPCVNKFVPGSASQVNFLNRLIVYNELLT